MTDTITPALSAEEWAAKKHVTPKASQYGDDHTIEVWPDGEVYLDNGEEASAGTTHVHVLMAFANHALPDTDPRKIRREDVARLRAGASHMTEEGWRGDDERDFVVALAAKLAALLPPE